MPGPGGNRGKKKKMVKASATKRYTEGYGKWLNAPGTNPGAEVYVREKRVSDAIRGWGSNSSKTRYGN